MSRLGTRGKKGRAVVNFELLDCVVEDGERAVVVRVKLAKGDERGSDEKKARDVLCDVAVDEYVARRRVGDDRLGDARVGAADPEQLCACTTHHKSRTRRRHAPGKKTDAGGGRGLGRTLGCCGGASSRNGRGSASLYVSAQWELALMMLSMSGCMLGTPRLAMVGECGRRADGESRKQGLI